MKKRIFFAFGVEAPWQEKEPPGRSIEKKLRHITLVFLGSLENEKIESILKKPSFKIGPVGIFDKILFLPPLSKRVAALHANFLSDLENIKDFRKELIIFLKEHSIFIEDKKKFLAHATLCRKPFLKRKWKANFEKLPFFIKDFSLLESLGLSKYKKIWEFKFIKPFEELEHTADIAFNIKGENFKKLYENAFIALCFKSKEMINYFLEVENINNIDDVIINLNSIIEKMDSDIGSPFKAVSFKADIKKEKDLLTWEMIVDV